MEVTQPCCPEVARNQIHVTADISFAVRNHFAATNDMEWLRREGCPLAIEIANFWKSRVVYNESTHFYDIRGWFYGEMIGFIDSLICIVCFFF